MLSTKLKEAAGNSADATLYVNDVFSTWLYTGNGSTQTINNGIDLAGKGGMVWTKERSAIGFSHQLIDSTRGISNVLISNNNSQQAFTTAISSFDSTGYTLSSTASVNYSGSTFVGWTFREAAKFFDVVTYTGTGSARTIAHSLGVAPGMVIVKRTDTTGDWQVYSNGLTSAAYSLILSEDFVEASAPTVWNSTAPTSSVFSVGTNATVNASGGTYVAYLFAHDTSSTGIIQCGSYVGNGSATGPVVTLGWEPQWILIKRQSGSIGNWQIIDSMRGMPVGSADAALRANLASAESSVEYLSPTATGFQITSSTSTEVNASGSAYIYMAIRMPNKPPTSGTQVYMPITYNGVGTAGQVISDTGFSPDFALSKARNTDSGFHQTWMDKLRGGTAYIFSDSTSAEGNTAGFYIRSFNMNGVTYGSPYGDYTNSSYTYVGEFFKRAPGFFDEVCYTGTGVATTQAHNLTVVPELIIVKCRGGTSQWPIYATPLGNSNGMFLSLTNASSSLPTIWNSTTPTSSVFTIGTSGSVNASGFTFVAYLFATLAGISKVGSYTGNGTGQAIACGFSAGARFVLIKRTDANGDWYTFDSARGLTSGSSPYLLLNSTAAEVTGNNGVYASTGGFTLGATASTTTNINGASYIYLSVA